MQGRPILYNGKPIDPDHFRVYIYQSNSIQKLVNSYDEYQKHLSSGLWFSSVDDIPVLKEKTRVKRTQKLNPDIEETKLEYTNDSFQEAAQDDKKDGFLDNIEGE